MSFRGAIKAELEHPDEVLPPVTFPLSAEPVAPAEPPLTAPQGRHPRPAGAQPPPRTTAAAAWPARPSRRRAPAAGLLARPAPPQPLHRGRNAPAAGERGAEGVLALPAPIAPLRTAAPSPAVPPPRAGRAAARAEQRPSPGILRSGPYAHPGPAETNKLWLPLHAGSAM